MPKELPNVYENVKEAMLRLRRTVVVYDGQPYVVLAITNHKDDNIFRIYLDPTAKPKEQSAYGRPEPEQFPPEHSGVGAYMDQWISEHPAAGILRKQMNSPLFNKFRPYRLGMCNLKGSGCVYLERMPNRKTEQGLVPSMINETAINVIPNKDQGRAMRNVDIYGEAFKDCVMGAYPTAKDCLANLLNPEVMNEAAAFHREFALVRGPLDMLFLAYKHEIVGVLPKNNFDAVRLGHEFQHTKEVVEQLGLFQYILR
jgi:hypothetical protein